MAKFPLFGLILEDADPASIHLMTAGDPFLARERNRLFRAIVLDTKDLKKHLIRSERELIQRIDRMVMVPGLNRPRARGGFTRDGTRLTSEGSRAMISAITRGFREAFDRIETVIDERVLRSVRRSMRIQANRLSSLGLPKLTKDQRRVIEQTARELLDSEFPIGSGMTYRRRLRRIHRERMYQAQRLVRRVYPNGDASERIVDNLKRSLTNAQSGTVIRGGTAFKQARRLMVAEETRIANAVELGVARAYGIKLVYWRLNPAHKWYGGKEICEVHASRVNSDVVRFLDSQGASTAGMELRGLYRLENYPPYPHPFCKCYPEPMMVTTKR